MRVVSRLRSTRRRIIISVVNSPVSEQTKKPHLCNTLSRSQLYSKQIRSLSVSMADSTTPKLKAEALFDLMKAHLTTDAGKEIVKKVGYVYQLNIAPKKLGFDEQVYIIDLKKGEISKGPYEGGKPDATLSFTDEDFIKIATGKMNPQIAFLRGAIKLKGSLSAAQKFTPDIFPKISKL